MRLVTYTHVWLRTRLERPSDDEGFSTAELLGNAALGVAALVAVWAVLQGVGIDVANWIRSQILG